MSPTNDVDREVMITPSDNMPTKSSPIAVSADNRTRDVITETPPIIATAPIAAPTTPGTPNSSARAIPGITPWASASPTNDRPRSTT